MANSNSTNSLEFSMLLELISGKTVRASQIKNSEEHFDEFILPFIDELSSLNSFTFSEKEKEFIAFLGHTLNRNY